MLSKKCKEAYDEWAGMSSPPYEGAGEYFMSARNTMRAINETFSYIGYNQHSIDYTVYICQDFGFDDGLDESCYTRSEARHRRQVVAKFLHELASKIESGEC